MTLEGTHPSEKVLSARRPGERGSGLVSSYVAPTGCSWGLSREVTWYMKRQGLPVP